MLAELKKHGTMHVPQVVFTGWEGNSLGMVMLLPKQDVFHAQAGSTQIYNYTEIWTHINYINVCSTSTVLSIAWIKNTSNMMQRIGNRFKVG